MSASDQKGDIFPRTEIIWALVAGEYGFDLPNPKTKAALKIVDMLGEEVLIIK